MSAPGLTYWRCPECREWFGLSVIEARFFERWQNPVTWGILPHTTEFYERLVEAHEARHIRAGT